MMRKTSSLLPWTLAAVLAAYPALAPSTEKARLDEIARKAAQDFAAAKAGGAADQTGPANPVPLGGQVIELTLDDAVERALDRNLELAVERMNPPSSTLNGGSVGDNDTTTYNMGIAQSVPWGGGSFSFQLNNNKQVSSN